MRNFKVLTPGVSRIQNFSFFTKKHILRDFEQFVQNFKLNFEEHYKTVLSKTNRTIRRKLRNVKSVTWCQEQH